MAHKTIPKSKVISDEGEKTFHLLFEGHPIPMFVVDLQTWKILKVNETMTEKYGYSCDEFQALTLQDILPTQDAARLLKPAKKKQPGLLPPGEWRHQCRDGRVIDVDITSHTLEFDGHPAALVIAQDITERKKTEQALRESEKRYHSLFESMLDGIYRSTPEGKFIYVNQAMVNMFGYSSVEELLEVDIINELYFAPEERHSEVESILDIKPEVYRMRRKDGTEIWVEDHETYLHNEQGKTLYHGGMLRDVTTRKQAEKALRESEERYQHLFNNMLDGYYRSTHEGKFLDVNPAMVKMFGYSSREEMLEMDIKKDLYFSPQERGTHILDTGLGETDVYRLRRKDGSEIWVEDRGFYIYDEQGRVIYHEGSLRDVTQRKQAEDAQRESEERYRQLVRLSLEPIYIFDSKTMKILEANPAFEKILGYTADEIEKMTIYDVIAHEQESIDAHTSQIKTFGPIDMGERQWRRKDGTLLTVHVTANKITVKGADAIFVTARDITLRKQSEDELLHAKESLERANRELEHVLAREQQLARTDGLTGLYNSRYFFELASREFSASMRYQRPLAILMFDTDDFKRINDTLGHTAGDKILTLVAQTAAEQMRAVDVLARYGGDEFVVLLAQTSAQQAFPIAERIRASVTALQIQTEKGPLNVTLSIGIAELWRNPADESIESIVQRADKALYTAKNTGRNRTVIFDPDGAT